MDSTGRGERVPYRRNRFSTRLPTEYLYTRSHFWLVEHSPNVWRIGLTRFATRMLGDVVEFEFEVSKSDTVTVGDVIGWIEGFKAVSDIFCVATGIFAGANARVVADPNLLRSSTYEEGWFYAVEGKPDPEAVDVCGYIEHLDRTIDAMIERPWQPPEMGRS